MHGQSLVDELLWVPLVIAAPGDSRVKAGSRVATPVRLADLMPTLLDLGGLPIPESLDGRSLRAGPRVEPVLAGLRMDGIELLTARRAEYKLVWDVANDEGRLYAPGAPGAEAAPIDPASRPGAERAEQQLRDLLEAAVAAREEKEQTPTGELPPEVQESLRALGHLE